MTKRDSFVVCERCRWACDEFRGMRTYAFERAYVRIQKSLFCESRARLITSLFSPCSPHSFPTLTTHYYSTTLLYHQVYLYLQWPPSLPPPRLVTRFPFCPLSLATRLTRVDSDSNRRSPPRLPARPPPRRLPLEKPPPRRPSRRRLPLRVTRRRRSASARRPTRRTSTRS